ncbi:vanadium-dependent haloperoxidase [Streptomyces sp. CC228A]|uniref:vanadium-dependent haloperoxidase n=1 Tax=Streptomyces sp. CC228A TaxID=2898186 RepID=UPI001F3F67A7|nr:vanadium-dependent haloperoxidase [Streptomyces sp. CC228A]
MCRTSARIRSRTAASLVGAALLALAPVLAHPPASAASAADPPSAPRAVIVTWARLAADTGDPGGRLTAPEEALWQGLVSAAMYNAVVGVEGRYEPYKWQARGPRGASAEAAAATAAHDVLLHYFPSAAGKLKAAHTASLAAVPDGEAEDRGVEFGRRAARHVIRLHPGTPRGAEPAYPAAPGSWRPTPPAHEPFGSAWLGRLRPLLLDRADRFRPPPPPALTSEVYTADFAEVKSYGARTGSRRSPQQTATALFFTKLDLQGALADRAERFDLDLVDTARLYAAVNTVQADAVIAAWEAKLHYGTWRPVTAIREADTDGNPHTAPDPAWEPLLKTPAHPDYLSGHTTAAGALTRTLTLLSGSPRLDLTVTSVTARKTRHYTYARDYDQDVVDARVWAGIHTRTADLAGTATGRKVAAWALTRYFRPLP